MGRMKELDLLMQEARPAAFKLLMEVRYDLNWAYEIAWTRIRLGLLELDGDVICAVIKQLHAEGEPLKGVTVVVNEHRLRDVG